MIIHPDVRALRGDDAPQREAQDLLEALHREWREGTAADVLSDLAAFDTARPLSECPALAALFEEGDASAARFVEGFTAAMHRGLARAPLGHVPVRHTTDGVTSTLLLARAGNVALSLVAVDGAGLARRPAPITADFSPRESWEHILAGQGDAELAERRSATDSHADLRRRAIRLQPGKVICRDAERQSLLLRGVRGCLVSLRLQRRRKAAGETREYRLDDGALVHMAAGNPRDSRVELMLALLGRMGRTDAAPLAAGIARGEGGDALRWQALRECIALDTLTGVRALLAVAARAADSLSVPAQALRAQLVSAYPQLADVAP